MVKRLKKKRDLILKLFNKRAMKRLATIRMMAMTMAKTTGRLLLLTLLPGHGTDSSAVVILVMVLVALVKLAFESSDLRI